MTSVFQLHSQRTRQRHVEFWTVLLGITAILACTALTGCVSAKAVDSTPVAEKALDADAENPQLIALQGRLLDDPTLADKVVVIPTVNGKNVRFTARYPDGTVKYELLTSRSEVIDSTLSRINDIDAGKFSHDRYLFDQTMQRFDRLMEMVTPILLQRAAAPAESTQAAGSLRDAVRDLLAGELHKLQVATPPQP